MTLLIGLSLKGAAPLDEYLATGGGPRGEGMAYFEAQHYVQALESFNRIPTEKRDVQVLYTMGRCAQKLRDYDAARSYFSKMPKKKPSFELRKKMYQHYGQCLLSQGEYGRSLRIFKILSRLDPENARARAILTFHQGKTWAEYQSPRIRNPHHKIVSLASNTTSCEYAPVMFLGGLIFSSTKRAVQLGLEFRDEIGEYFSNLYITEDGKNSKLVKNMGANWHYRFHELPMQVDAEGNLWFIRYTLMEEKNEKVSEVFKMKKEKGKWKKPEPQIVFREFRMHSFCMDQTGNRMIFSREVKSKTTHFDLFEVTRKQDGNWGDPVPLGPNINSPGNEVYPFLSPNGRLYFSSDGHAGFGGLDMYFSYKENDQWIFPKNLGLPFNSNGEDYGYVSDAMDTLGYFVSNRMHGGFDDDIYQFSQAPLDPPPCEQVDDQICARISIDSLQAQQGGYYRAFVWTFNMKDSLVGDTVEYCQNSAGDVFVTVFVWDSIEGKPVSAITKQVIYFDYYDRVWFPMSDTLVWGDTLQLDATQCTFNDLHISEVEWVVSPGKRVLEEKTSYVFEEPGAYEVRCYVRGENENTGSKAVYCGYRVLTVVAPPHQELPDSIKQKLALNCAVPPAHELFLKSGVLQIEPGYPLNEQQRCIEVVREGSAYRYRWRKASKEPFGVAYLDSAEHAGFTKGVLILLVEGWPVEEQELALEMVPEKQKALKRTIKRRIKEAEKKGEKRPEWLFIMIREGPESKLITQLDPSFSKIRTNQYFLKEPAGDSLASTIQVTDFHLPVLLTQVNINRNNAEEIPLALAMELWQVSRILKQFPHQKWELVCENQDQGQPLDLPTLRGYGNAIQSYLLGTGLGLKRKKLTVLPRRCSPDSPAFASNVKVSLKMIND